jgi:TonB family protein
MRLRAILLSLVVVSMQVVPPAVAPALAQFGSRLPPTENPSGLTQRGPDPLAGCFAVPEVQSFPVMDPLKEDKSARVDQVVGKDGRIISAKIGDGSGDVARDAALLAHVRQHWRYRPLARDCDSVRIQTRLHFPHITCAPQPLPEAQTAPDVDFQDRPRSVDLQVGVVPDGTVILVSVTRSSGDAALDAAAIAHVKAAWRWQPYVCKDATGDALPMVMGAATIQFPYAVPDPPER